MVLHVQYSVVHDHPCHGSEPLTERYWILLTPVFSSARKEYFILNSGNNTTSYSPAPSMQQAYLKVLRRSIRDSKCGWERCHIAIDVFAGSWLHLPLPQFLSLCEKSQQELLIEQFCTHWAQARRRSLKKFEHKAGTGILHLILFSGPGDQVPKVTPFIKSDNCLVIHP